MSTFDYRNHIKALLLSTGITDPGALADVVANQIPDEDLRPILAQTLRDTVRHAMGELRRGSAPAPIAGPSAKVARIRDGWGMALLGLVHVGGGERKALGECTYEDLYAAAAEREALAARNQAWARHYHSLAALLTEYGVETVRELPAEVLMPAIGAAV